MIFDPRLFGMPMIEGKMTRLLPIARGRGKQTEKASKRSQSTACSAKYQKYKQTVKKTDRGKAIWVSL